MTRYTRGLVPCMICIAVVATDAETATPFVHDGRTTYEVGEFHGAISLSDKAIEASPDDPRARCDRGMAFIAIAEYDKALLDFDEVLKAAPDDAHAQFGRGLILRRRGNVRESMASLTRAIRLEPTGEAGFLARCERALLFVDLGDLVQAKEDAEAAIGMCPQHAEGYLARGSVHLAHGTDEEWELGRIDCDRALEIRPHYIDAMIRRAMVFADECKPIETEKLVERAIKLHGNDDKHPLLGMLHAVRAYGLLAYGVPIGARDDAADAVELAPREAFAHYVHGDCFLRLREPERAVESFSRCIEIGGPMHIEAGPLQSMAHALRGDAHADCGRYVEAVADYSQAVALRLPKERLSSLYYNRAIAFENLGDFRNAIVDYTLAIELSPTKAECYNNRANLYGWLGDEAKAMADYAKAIEFDPKDPAPYANRGRLYYQKEQFDSALADFDKAISLARLQPSLYWGRADVHEAKGMRDKAQEDRDQAKQLDPLEYALPKRWEVGPMP